jgi:hypothetical protein
MENPSYRQGFTRKELVVALAVLFLLGTCLGVFVLRAIDKEMRVSNTSLHGRSIHMMLSDWADDHDGEFPTARQYSNEAFRELFKARFVNTEQLFAIEGDPWHKNSPSGDGKRPDNHIGNGPDYAQALTRGECAYAYVSGLNRKSDPEQPLFANAFSESLGVYTESKSHKGGVFRGEKCVWVTVGGSARVGDLSSDFRLLEKKNGKTVDVFSKEWGTNPDNIKNPEG